LTMTAYVDRNKENMPRGALCNWTDTGTRS